MTIDQLSISWFENRPTQSGTGAHKRSDQTERIGGKGFWWALRLGPVIYPDRAVYQDIYVFPLCSLTVASGSECCRNLNSSFWFWVRLFNFNCSKLIFLEWAQFWGLEPFYSAGGSIISQELINLISRNNCARSGSVFSELGSKFWLRAIPNSSLFH